MARKPRSKERALRKKKKADCPPVKSEPVNEFQMPVLKRPETRTERDSQLQREADAHNATIIPETPGYIRMDGPRRQSRCVVRGGVKYFIEL